MKAACRGQGEGSGAELEACPLRSGPRCLRLESEPGKPEGPCVEAAEGMRGQPVGGTGYILRLLLSG